MKKLLVLLALGLSSHALAWVNGQLQFGRRWYVAEDKSTMNGNQFSASVHVDPIPLVPVSLGVGMANIAMNDVEDSTSSSTITETTLELMAWVPMIPVVTPYVKFAHILSSTLQYKFESEAGVPDVDADITGMNFAAGLMFKLLPFIKLTVEGGSHQGKFKIVTDSTLKAQYLLIGIQAGI